MKKKIILSIANFISIFWCLLPFKLRKFLFTSLFIIESRGKNTKAGLKRIFKIKDNLDWIINERAIIYGNGIHPKHKVTTYHKFFIDRVCDGEIVLDVGCGNGTVAIDIASQRPKSFVIGVDINVKNIEAANKQKIKNSVSNINFIFGDISSQTNINSDVVILSNILEHINKRKEFLENIILKTSAKKFLIRVPLFERDWQIAFRKEIGSYYFSDQDHKIEHTLEEFKNEILLSKLKITEIFTIWGEIWATCVNDQ
ncbi:hypothetical protein CU313_06785 [Prochlorococcus marinus str. MU1404]|uniref:class I SAM-dependent methyltransferase n=1 Tax=Prochlorococcus marinus TaxID=1219 RepID=UPI001ADA141B|nr:class I SAM-dependent methyltransferase [Prochlorococcus marinus]MBO8230527.1 methyltransferase domain-containing protein [Prochlorococcus marinus XMU1404]MBW3073573.1 hypothetical protein [Prochlorococcus marinus str. MU1404]MCR8545139.1 methyltransferase domain-containing protein [Prochlorococcus marinus CUG1432]